MQHVVSMDRPLIALGSTLWVTDLTAVPRHRIQSVGCCSAQAVAGCEVG